MKPITTEQTTEIGQSDNLLTKLFEQQQG